MKIKFLRLSLVQLITFALVINISNGLYIKTTSDNANQYELSVFKQKHGLSNQKVKLLKSQKNQQDAFELINRYVEENRNYNANNVKITNNINSKSSNIFLKVYHNLLKQLRFSSGTLKTLLNFELSDKPEKNLSRSRRKIAVKMLSNMPSEKIDELVQTFNEKHDVNNYYNYDNDIPEKDGGYTALNLPSAVDSDYVYENLYEDEEDLTVQAKSNHNSQFASLQDLILLANRNQWHREIAETKLSNPNTERFV